MPKLSLFRRLGCAALLTALSSTLYAESLSPQGAVLSNINIFPDDSQHSISKSIEVGDAQVVETYILVQLKEGSLFKKTSTGFAPLTGAGLSLSNLNLPVNNGSIAFDVVSGSFFNLLDYPMTVYLGFLDNKGSLYFGAFKLTADLETLSSWNETAVRKVLQAFAFGGFASKSQIQTWATMLPSQAIVEMLTLDTVNSKLSPADAGDVLEHPEQIQVTDPTTKETAPLSGTVKSLSAFWSGSDALNPFTKADKRKSYSLEDRRGAERTWRQAVNLRGLNPVRQRVGFWETNYHFSVNLDADVGINNYQMARYYDDINAALAAAKPYQDVVSVAALSSAVAIQFNHRRNTFDNTSLVFRGNEDFAREYHQIFFGILGNYNPTYHEEVAIPNTAQLLTDMPVNLVNGRLDEVVTFGTEKHHVAPLDILNTSIAGETAQTKLNALSQIAINQAESLQNLPIILIRGFADDELNEAKIKVIQSAWANRAQKDLLKFLQSYAISTLFHSNSRVKYHSVIDRYLLALNQMTLSNAESYLDLYQIDGYSKEGVQVFRPLHDVFGGQTGAEAADSAEVFRAVYNRSTQSASVNQQAALEENGQVVWTKDWGSVIASTGLSTSPSSGYTVQQVTEFLWQRFMADGLKNLGELERLQLYALLATGTDAGYALDPNNAERVFTRTDLSDDAVLKTAMNTWANTALPLGGNDSPARRSANANIGLAINFLNALPFIFAQEGA